MFAEQKLAHSVSDSTPSSSSATVEAQVAHLVVAARRLLWSGSASGFGSES